MSFPTRPFKVVSEFTPTGDQPSAIAKITRGFGEGSPCVCLLGATGTGKTFTMANVIARLGKPALILSHNKTLAAQLFEEMRELFPENSVNYFVSYYDYYQPEAYIPQRDIYIEKDSSRNDDLDQLRLAATSNILSRRDTIVVASVSCIFGLGSPQAYGDKVLTLTRGSLIDRRALFLALNSMQYQRTDIEWKRGQFRVRGDALDIWPAYEKFAVHLEFFGGEIERIDLINPVSGEVIAEERQFFLFPAVHYVMPEERLHAAIEEIRTELNARVLELRSQGKLIEAQRLLARTKYDIELLAETGVCPGIENYSRFMDGRAPGERPFCLMDYFDFAPPAPGAAMPEGAPPGRHNFRDWLLIIDESHVTIPQIRAMFNGDRARKTVLVEHGFRLPSALDNRPLRFEEFEAIVPLTLFVSATPGPYELGRTGGEVAEQVIRPTGLLDPRVEIKPTDGQVTDLLEECNARVSAGERVLVTALTKRLCEDLAEYLEGKGLRVRYLHSDIETLERVQILSELRQGMFDVLVGVNLLREGLDLPEVSLVAILDADKEGFLRSPTSLIQLMGRAARNVNGRVVMYADKMTPAMRAAIEETERRREKQEAYNKANGITPQTISKAIRRGIELELRARKTAREAVGDNAEPPVEIAVLLETLNEEMLAAAQSMEFEKAAVLRDQIVQLRQKQAATGAGGNSVMVRRSDLGAGASTTPRRKGDGRPGSPGSRGGKRRG
ncbi:MAG: excinuclease ABC subunit UvrB [Phycisphaeraceae bacterium]|nr:excinuclease ABC subunit UvrB [Phycisphaeraceae bacterium]